VRRAAHRTAVSGQATILRVIHLTTSGWRRVPLDYDELERWTRVGFEREVAQCGARNGEGPLAFVW
jgi:hypothetical protein